MEIYTVFVRTLGYLCKGEVCYHSPTYFIERGESPPQAQREPLKVRENNRYYNRMNRYNFVRVCRPEATADSVAKAATITSVEALLNISKAIGEYQFEESKELSDAFAKAQSVTTRIETLPSGVDINRVEVVLNEAKYICRAFGSGRGNILPAKAWTAKEIKEITAGFCKSDDDIITDLREDKKGGIVKVPVIYVKIA